MSRISDLAADLVALGKQENISPVLQEMLRILKTKEERHPVEKVIGYLEGQLKAILERVDTRRQAEQERNRLELQPVLEAARLAQTSGRTDKARRYYEASVQREPDWPSALENYAWFLFDQSIESKYHGSLQAAAADAERSFDFARRLYEQDVANPEAQRVLAAASEQVGDLLVIRGQPGDAEQALQHYTRDLELSESLLKRNPDSAQAARDVSVSLEKLGDFLAQRGQPGDAEQALQHYTRDLELSESLLKRNPDSAQAARDVSVSLNRLGDFLAQRGQPGDAEQALQHYTRGLELSESLLKRNADSAQAARDVSVSLEKLGDFLAQRGQPGDAEQALQHYTRGLELSESLLKRNADSAQAARDVSVSLEKLGDFLAQRGQPGDAEQALQHYTRGLELRESLLKRNPDSAQAARDVSVSLNRLGDFLAQRGQPGDAEQALQHYTRGLELRESLLKRNPDSAQAARDVSVSLNKLGDFLAQRGQPGDAEQALQHYTRGLELRESLLKRNPDSAQAARDVSVSLNRLGDFLAQRGQPGDAEQALQHYTRGLELSESLLKRNPDSAQAARDVSVSLNKLGDFLAQRGQPGDAEQALQHYTRGLELSESLLKRNPDSAQAARDVSVSLNKLGDFLAQRGQPGDAEQALQHYTRGLELSESLLKRNPDSAQAARDVMISHYKLGELKIKTMEIEPAISHLGQGIQVLDAMISKGLNTETAKRERAILVARSQYCENMQLATSEWDTLLKSASEILPELLSLRVTVMARRGQLSAVAQAGDKLRELKPKTGANLYNAACAYALCAGLVIKDKKEPTQAAAAERQRYMNLALDCLKEAIAAGFSDFPHMQNDTDLIALRGLPEFERLFPKEGSK